MALQAQELTDEEIRSALAAHGVKNIPPITNTSRPLLLRKIQKLSNSGNTVEEKENAPTEKLTNSSTDTKNEVESTTSSQQQDSSAEEGFYDAIEGYYAVVMSQSDAVSSPATKQPQSETKQIFTSKKEALKAIKNISGARVHEFNSQVKAEKFLQDQSENSTTDTTQPEAAEKPLLTSERPNEFPTVKTQDLSKLRRTIETGDLSAFRETVWSNPRHLITSGDTPTVLKIPTWYNALHCAVQNGRLEFCQEIVDIIQDDRFWMLVYPDDSEGIRANRKEHLLDLYLNTQDKLGYETPLHFASKLGHVEIVSYLLSLPRVEVDALNKDGKTPADVACTRTSKATNETKQRIKELFIEPENFFVSVVRSVDNSTPPHLSPPCQLHELSPSLDKVGTPTFEHALAGPMSPTVAEQFYREWRSPSNSQERKDASHIKRSDPDRGFERVGRQIAHKKGVGWVEYWDFLGCSCDLSTIEGQEKLEEYLAKISPSPQPTSSDSFTESSPKEDSSNNEEDPLVVRLVDRMSSPSSKDGEEMRTDEPKKELNTSDLAKLLESELTLDSPSAQVRDSTQGESNRKTEGELSEEALRQPQETKGPEPGTSIFSTPLKSSSPIIMDKIFLAGTLPTKLDYDVKLAIGSCKPDPSKFPCICHWLELVKGYSEQEQASWRTPKKQWTKRSDFSHPVSPLVISSPTTPGSRHIQAFSPLVSASPTRATGGGTPINQTPVRSYHINRRTPGYRSVNTTPHGHSPLHNSRHEPRTTVAGRTTLSSRF